MATVGQWLPVWALGGHATFPIVAGRLIPTPVVTVADCTIDAVGFRPDAAITGTLTFALYTWDGVAATKVADLGASTNPGAGLEVVTFSPRVLTAGTYVVITHASAACVLWGQGLAQGVYGQAPPNSGTSLQNIMHATGSPPLPASITFDSSAGTGGNGNVPRVMLRRSA